MRSITIALVLLICATLPVRGETYDHLLRFADEATAIADPVISKYYIPASSSGDPGGWRGDITIPNVSVYSYAVDGVTRVPFAGWFLIVSLTAPSAAIEGVANAGCRLVADRDQANAGNPNFIIYTAADLTPTELAAAHIEPTAAGSNYPFGN